MESAESSFLVWLVNQGVAVAVVAFVLWRLEGKLDKIHTSLDELQLALLRAGVVNGQTIRVTIPPTPPPPAQGGA